MAGLHFDITADNTSFIQRVNEIKRGVQSASGVIQRLGKDFDVSTVENKVIALNKVIRENESTILSLDKEIQKWGIDAKEAFNANDMSTFSLITKDIEEQALKISQLRAETQEYYAALAMVESAGGVQAPTAMEVIDAPKLFKSQEDYEYAESLRIKIAQLQEQIADFQGSDAELQPLRSELSRLQGILGSCETEAAHAASALGSDLGGRASEAAESLYQLNSAVEKQQLVVSTLSVAAQEASAALESLKGSDDLTAVDNAQIKYDTLSTSLRNAQMELMNLKAAQSDAQVSFNQINAEVQQHDSFMVKMLGGYEKYSEIISHLPGPVQNVITSINGMTGAARAFIATPLGAIIGAIVLALQALKTWFDSSVEGQLAFAEISGYVGGVLDQLKEIVITVGKAIYDAFSNPKQAVADLWSSIKANIVNRFKAVGDIAIGLGKVIENAFSGKFGEAGKELSGLRDKFVQLGTGVENATGKIVKYAKGVHEAAKANARLNKEERLIDIDASKESIESSKRNKRMQQLRVDMYSNDKGKGAKALAEYRRLSEEQMNAELKLQDRRIALQDERMSLTTNAIEDENKLRELQKQRVDIEAQNASRMAMLQRRANRIEGSGKSTGPTTAQIASAQMAAHRKLIDLMKSQAEERLRLQQEFEMQQWQNRIDLMAEGAAKAEEQRRLDFYKEQYSLESQKEQAIQTEIARQKALFEAREDEKAAGNKKYAKKTFNPGENIEETVKHLASIEDAVAKASEELAGLVEAEGSRDEIERCKKKIDTLVKEHERLSSEMGDVTDSEIREIISKYTRLYDDLEKMQDKSYTDRIRDAQASLDEYLKQYGSYEQKRLAITKEWNEKIAQATPAERPMLEAGKNEALGDLKFEQWKKSGEISKAFGDIKKLSASTVKELIRHMERYRSKVIDTFDPAKIKEYENALRDLQDIDVENSLGIFAGFVPDAFKEAAAHEREMVEYEKQMSALIEKRGQLQNQIISQQGIVMSRAREQGIDLKIEDISGSGAFDNVSKIFENAGVKMSEGLQSSLSSLTGSFGELGGIQDMIGSLGGMMGGGVMATMNKVGAIVHAVNDSVQSLKGLFDDLMNTADALGADTEVGSNWAQASIIMDGFAEASQGATDAFDSLKSGNPIGVIQGVVKSFTAWIRAFSAFKDAKHERTIQNLQKQIEKLDESYEKLGKSVEDAYSTDASDLIEQQNTLLKQKQTLMRQQIAEEKAKKKTDKKKVKEWEKQLEEIDETIEDNGKKAKEAIIGKDIKSAIDEFASAYAEAWESGTDAAQASMKAVKSIISSALNELTKKRIQPAAQKFYDKLAEAMEGGILTDAELKELDAIKAEMDALAAQEEEQYKTIQERYKDLDELREELTDISFDSVRDDFKSLLLDMESTTEDFTENFTEMIRNALIEGLMNNKYDAMLKEWYAEFADAMSDKELTDEERERLRQRYNEIVQQGIDDRNVINDIVGGGSYSQSASKGDAWNMSQETGEELNGRFTAMVELEAVNNTLVSEGNMLARDILATIRSLSNETGTVSGGGNNETLLSIKDMLFLSTGHLEDISGYTKNLNMMRQDISDMKEVILRL